MFSAFNFAFDLAKTAMTSKLPDIYLKRAMHLEDEVNDNSITEDIKLLNSM